MPRTAEPALHHTGEIGSMQQTPRTICFEAAKREARLVRRIHSSLVEPRITRRGMCFTRNLGSESARCDRPFGWPGIFGAASYKVAGSISTATRTTRYCTTALQVAGVGSKWGEIHSVTHRAAVNDALVSAFFDEFAQVLARRVIDCR